MMRKKFISIILVLIMVLTTMPVMAFASFTGTGTADDPYLVSTEAELKTALASGGAIKLNADIECAKSATDPVLSITNDVTIDINGKKLSGDGESTGGSDIAFFGVSSEKILTIVGTGTIDFAKTNYYGYVFRNNGGVINVKPTDSTLYVNTGYSMIAGATNDINITGGTYNKSVKVDTNNYKCTSYDGNKTYVVEELPVICTVNGTEYKTIAAAMEAAKVSGVITYPIILTDNASYGSTISEDYEFQGSDYTLSLNYYVRGGIYKCNVYAKYGIEGGKFDGNITLGSGWTITGGEFKNDPAGKLGSDYGTILKDNYYFVAKTANITEGKITGGLYYNDPSAYVASGYTVLSRDTAPKYYVAPESNVNNGKIFKGVYYGDSPKTDFLADGYKTGTVKDSGSNTCYIVGKNVSVSNNKVIGGIFAEDPSTFVDTNTFDVTENEGEWTVTLKPGYGAAKIGETEYATVANAITAASNGDTIVLQKNTIDEQITFSSAKQLTFDLQNYHVANSNGRGMYVSGGSGCVITIKGGAESYINGSTSAVETSSSYTQLVFGEEFLGKVETTIKKSSGTITIKGGLYKTGVSIDNFLDITRGTDTTSVEGYTKVVPLTAENADCAVITAGGEETYYRLTSNNSLDISNAWSAADGNTLKLLKDTPTIGYFEADPGSGKSLILDLNGKKITNNSTYAVYLYSGNLTVQGNGTIDASGTGASYGIQACNGTTLNISNGTIIGKYNAVYGDYSSSVTVNINGGTLTKGLSVAGSGSVANIYGGTFTGYCFAINGATLNVYAGEIENISSNSYQNSIVNISGGSIGYSQNFGTTNVSGGYVKDEFYTNPSYQSITFNLTGGEYGFDPSSYISDTEHYSAEVVTEGVRWKVVQKGVVKPEIVTYLEGDNTNTFTLADNLDISDYAYSFTSVGTKTIDLAGHTLTVNHDRFNVGGTLNITNSDDSQASVEEPVEVLEGYNRGIGSTITVNSSGTLTIDGNIRVYGNANAISAMANSKLNITGAAVEANYNAAIGMFSGTEATIDNATIISHSSSTVNNHAVWSYAIRSDYPNAKLAIMNSTVSGVQGAIGISGEGSVANITGCALTASHTPGYTDCHAALYVATKAVANVYSTKMKSDRANYAAYSGNNDITEYYGTINLYAGCMLSDKYYMQATKSYGDPATYCKYVANTDVDTKDEYPILVMLKIVAKIGDTTYTTLQEAFDNAVGGDVIDIIDDIQLSSPARLDKEGTYVVNGNGHKISATDDANFGSDGCLCFGPGGNGTKEDIPKKIYTIKNTTFSGFSTGTKDVIRAEGCTLTIDRCTFDHNTVETVPEPTRSGAVVLFTGVDAKVINTKFTENQAKLCIDFNTQGGSENAQAGSNIKIDNCYFAENNLTGNGVVYLYGPKGSVTNNTFVDNAITADGASVIYLSGKADRIANNLFKDNEVTAGGSGKLGVIALGSNSAGTVLEENAFANNTLNKNSVAPKAGTVYVGADSITLERNYWGDGKAPELEDGKDVYLGKIITVEKYATAYSTKTNSYGVNVTIAQNIAKNGDITYTSYADAKTAAPAGKFGAGWYFNVDPANDLAESCTVVASDDAAWTYKIVARAIASDIKTDIESGVKEAVAATANEVVVSAAAVVNNIDKTLGGVKDLQPDAASKLNDTAIINNTLKESASNELIQDTGVDYNADEDTVMIVIEPYFDINVKDGAKDTTSPEKITSITYEIDAKYNILATTATTTEQIVKEGAGKNTVVLETNQVLDVTKAVTLTIPLPLEFNAGHGVTVYIKHTHGNNQYVYGGTVSVTGTAPNQVKTVTFVNPNGFSEFTIVPTLSTVAKVTQNSSTVYFESLQDAANYVAEGGTLTLLADASDATIARSVSFTFNQGSFTGDIVAGSNTVRTVSGSSYTFVYTEPAPPTPPAGGGGAATPKPTEAAIVNPFVDVEETAYYYDAVMWAVENGITSGVDATHFDPKNITTRAQMVAFLWRAAGCPEPKGTACAFTDVKSTSYYYKAVLWAIEEGITMGTTDTTFSPNKTVTRAQAVAFLARMSGVTDEAAGYTHGFTDVKTTAYYNNAVAWAAENKITEGMTATTFAPNNNCLRGQIVSFLYRYFVK